MIDDASTAHLTVWSPEQMQTVDLPYTGGKDGPPQTKMEGNREFLRYMKDVRQFSLAETRRRLLAIRHFEKADVRNVTRSFSALISCREESGFVVRRAGHVARRAVDDRVSRYMPSLSELEKRWLLIDELQNPCVKATLRYLDLIFLHPFNDGNARTARLILEGTLMLAGLRCPSLMAMVCYPKEPGDIENNLRFLNLVSRPQKKSCRGRRLTKNGCMSNLAR